MTIEVRDNIDESRYEAALDGVPLGFAYYQLADDRVVFTHTEVLPEAEGKGVASTLIRWALDDVRRQGKQIVPLCPFVAAFLKRHPDYADLVA
ncbi:MAG TPA: GNAT family N-acetyltransferase [Jatrophihabitantaceae bacterium]|nr:GNAT family N-acetyltransferase [Jatrophihabitantaceae bacterium]